MSPATELKILIKFWVIFIRNIFKYQYTKKVFILFIIFAELFFCSQLYAKSMRSISIRIKNKSGDYDKKLYSGSYALLIGVSNYLHWPDLPGVKDDIEAVKVALETNGFLVVKVMNPNKDQMEDAFEKFINNYGNKQDNRLLFYFAGHGHTIKPKYGGEPLGYIVPKEAPNPNRDPRGFKSKAFSMQRIEEYALTIDSKHALFLFDACFSGSIFSLSRAIPEHISYKTAKPVRQFITSGNEEETVPDYSHFRRQFIAAIEGEADVDRDGYITGSELGEFIQKKVVNYSNGTQHPLYGKIRNPNLDKGDFVFVPSGLKDTSITNPSTRNQYQRIDGEEEFWKEVRKSNNLSDLKQYLNIYPNGRFVNIAHLKIKKIEEKTDLKNKKRPKANNSKSRFPTTKTDGTQFLKTEKDRISYSIGLNIGNNFISQSLDKKITLEVLEQGIIDAYFNKKPLLSNSEIKKVMNKFRASVKKK